jgi:hypothetical protein
MPTVDQAILQTQLADANAEIARLSEALAETTQDPRASNG